MASDPRVVIASDFPAKGTFEEQAIHLIACATLAPSGHNTQPWRFVIEDRAIALFADRSRALPVVDPEDRELVISCGAALGALETAARHFGFDPAVAVGPEASDPDLIARIHLAALGRATADTAGTFAAIGHRRTARSTFGPDVPGDALCAECADLAAAHGITFTALSERSARERVAELVAEGDRTQFASPSFRAELASWVHSTRLGGRDGMSGTSFGMPDLLSPLGSLAIRTFDMGRGIAAADRDKIVEGTPLVAILSSRSDDPAAWTETGRALMAVLLRLTAAGYTASYLNQPVEVPTLRPRLAELLPSAGLPQIVLRIGRTAVDHPPTVRRDVADVIGRP